MMWQTKYASAVFKNFGVGVNFRLFSEDYFLSGHSWSVVFSIVKNAFKVSFWSRTSGQMREYLINNGIKKI